MNLNPLIRTPFTSNEIDTVLSAYNTIKAMLKFELAVLDLKAKNDLLDSKIASEIKAELTLSKFDLKAIEKDTFLGGNAAIPFVKQAKKILSPELVPYWHQHLTSQDLIDTAMMMQTQEALEIILTKYRSLFVILINLIKKHENTPMIGRTLMQQALPITFGNLVAQWSNQLISSYNLLKTAKHNCFLQWGGPVGISDNISDQFSNLMSHYLDLTEPLLPWHTNRQPIHLIMSSIDACAGANQKIVEDISLCSMSEIQELLEPEISGMGESSSMPHKRNPILCTLIKADSISIHGHFSTFCHTQAQAWQRSSGEWHASWQPLFESLSLLGASANYLHQLLDGLIVLPNNMLKNLDLNSDSFFKDSITFYLTKTRPETAQNFVNDIIKKAHHNRTGFIETLRPALTKDEQNIINQKVNLMLNSESSKKQNIRVVNTIKSLLN